MFGQGSPKWLSRFAGEQIRDSAREAGWARCTRHLRGGRRLVICLIFLFPGLPSIVAQEKPQSVRVRAIWGGPMESRWTGKITVSDGSFANPTTLGVEQNACCSTIVRPTEIQIVPNHLARFNGIDIEVTAAKDAFLYIEIQSSLGRERYRKSIAIKELLVNPIQVRIDQKQNYLSVFRSPGDEIRIEFENDSMIFSTGERFSPIISANQLGLQPHSQYRVQYSLRGLKDSKQAWHQTQDLDTDENGRLISLKNPSLKLPDREGVFEFSVTMTERKIRNFSRQKFQRNFDFVVLSAKRPRSDSSDISPMWQNVSQVDLTNKPAEFDPLNPSTFLARWQRNDLGNQKSSIVDLNSRPWMRMDLGSWHAYPIDIRQPDQPHILEIEFPSGLEMSTGISILQQSNNGQFDSLGADTGFHVRQSPLASKETVGQVKTHRIVFWPKRDKVFVVIANRHSSQPAFLGKMNVLAGPKKLSPAVLALARSSTDRPVTGRQFMAYYENPFFPDQFDSPKHHDQRLNQSLTDWQFFYQGADRLIQYLKANGQTGAMITVVADGSTIYPSQLLRPGPKFDNGIFSTDRPDLYRKDVMELLLRMFEREGLVLVPVLEFSAPLPELDDKLANETADASLILLNTKSQQPNWGGPPYPKPAYNLLSSTVQQGIENVVAELLDRYTDHAALGGISIKLSPETFAILAGQRWGFDPVTVGNFLRDQKLDAQAIDHRSAIERITRGDLNAAWRAWRIKIVTQFYARLAKTVHDSSNRRKLYLASVDLFRDQDSHSALAPHLRWPNDYQLAMRNLGLDPDQLDQVPHLIMLRPNRLAVGESMHIGRVEHELNHSPQKQKIDLRLNQAGDLFTSRDHWVHFSQLQKTSPFHQHQSALLRLQPLTPVGWQNRERFAQSLASCDSKLIASGGLVLPTGQESSMASWMAVYTALPPTSMHTVASASPQPVVVRQIYHQGKFYFYAVNNSPWQVDIEIMTNRKLANPVQSLGRHPIHGQNLDAGTRLAIQIPPFELIGGIVKTEDQDLKIASFKTTLESTAGKRIQDRISHLKKKITLLDQVGPLPSLPNASFEVPEKGSQPAQWSYDSNRMFDLTCRTMESIDGEKCLHLKSDQGVVWLRSSTFDAPQTGRLSLSVWLRIDDPKKQPPLRLAIQGKHHGKEYYRFANVGSLVPDGRYNQIGQQWKRFAVHFDDLPPVGLTDLQVGLDLMGKGQVWVDHIQLFDRWFDFNDRKALNQTLALAGYQLVNKGDYNGSRRLLRSYWPMFLDRFIQSDAEQSRNIKRDSEGRDSQAEERTSSLFDRVRLKFPNRIFNIR